MRNHLLKTVIAEDEPIVGRYMASIIRSMGGLDLIEICETGEDALAVLEREHIELLITDIRMPGISGLELIREGKKIRPDLTAVVISGYKNFDYLKEALLLDVENYITKPIDVEETKQTLERVLLRSRRTRQIEDSMELENIIRDFDEEKLAQMIQPDQYSLLAVYWNREIERDRIYRMLSEDQIAFFYRNGFFVLERESKKKDGVMTGLQKLFHAITMDELLNPCTACIIRHFEAGDNSCETYRRIYQILHYYAIPGRRSLKQYNTVDELKRPVEEGDSEMIKQLCLHISAHDSQSILPQVEELFAFWEENRYSLHRIKKGLHQVTDTLDRSGSLTEEKVVLNEYLDDHIRYAAGYRDLFEKLCPLFERNVRDVIGREHRATEDLFDKIREMVLRTADRNYSLSEICSIFEVSQPYVRKIFRAKVGMSYNEWIVHYKINYAKELMEANPRLLVKEVADRVGYDQLYFSTLFTRYVGISPSEYKREKAEE